MTELITEPTAEQIAAIKATHGHRFPVRAGCTVPGDGGRQVTLVVVLGNPTGACKHMRKAEQTQAWDDTIGITLKARPDHPRATDDLVEDCLLWPDRVLWSQWLARWPALIQSLRRPVIQKCGASLDMIEEPRVGDEPPTAIAQALEGKARAVWRKLVPTKKDALAIAVEPPNSAVWRMFVDALGQRSSEPTKLVNELALGCVLACSKIDGGALDFAQAVERWPGLALITMAQIGQLAGAAAEVELGEL